MSKSRRRQSPLDQIARLANGCCPVHGLFMGQVDGWFWSPGKPWFTLVECPRRNCEQRAKAYTVDGPWERWDGPRIRRVLAQEFDHERPIMEVLAISLANAVAMRDSWSTKFPRRPLPPFVMRLFDEIADRATEL